jgi:hypothetical protein
VFAPTGTPKPIIDQVAQANLALLADHDYRELVQGSRAGTNAAEQA